MFWPRGFASPKSSTSSCDILARSLLIGRKVTRGCGWSVAFLWMWGVAGVSPLVRLARETINTPKASSQSTRGVESKSCRDLRMSPECFHGITQDDRGRLGQRMIRKNNCAARGQKLWPVRHGAAGEREPILAVLWTWRPITANAAVAGFWWLD